MYFGLVSTRVTPTRRPATSTHPRSSMANPNNLPSTAVLKQFLLNEIEGLDSENATLTKVQNEIRTYEALLKDPAERPEGTNREDIRETLAKLKEKKTYTLMLMRWEVDEIEICERNLREREYEDMIAAGPWC